MFKKHDSHSQPEDSSSAVDYLEKAARLENQGQHAQAVSAGTIAIGMLLMELVERARGWDEETWTTGAKDGDPPAPSVN